MSELNVVYLSGSVQIQRKMNAEELSALLLDPDIVLIAVNAEKKRSVYRKHKSDGKMMAKPEK